MKISFWEKITGLSKDKLNQGEISFIKEAEEQENFFDQLEKESSPAELTKDKERNEFIEHPWLEEEGQLTVDVYQADNEIVVQSTIAGIKRKDLKISVEKDLITIKGERKKDKLDGVEYIHQECFWGKFSRSVVLPQEVDPEQVKAGLKNGVLTIVLPKIKRASKKTKIAKIKGVKPKASSGLGGS